MSSVVRARLGRCRQGRARVCARRAHVPSTVSSVVRARLSRCTDKGEREIERGPRGLCVRLCALYTREPCTCARGSAAVPRQGRARVLRTARGTGRRDRCIDMSLEMCIDMCIDVCIDICIDICIDMCIDI